MNLGSQGSARAETFTEAVASMVVHGNICLAREHAWKFMPCKGVATIEATTSVKVSALVLS